MENFKNLNEKNFIRLSRSMIKVLDESEDGSGLEAAVLLCELIAEYEFYVGRKMLTEDGYFFSTVENIKNKIGLSKHKQLEAVKLLKGHGIIDCKQKGLPSKRYFKILKDGTDNLRKKMKIYEKNNSDVSLEVDDKNEVIKKKDFSGYSF